MRSIRLLAPAAAALALLWAAPAAPQSTGAADAGETWSAEGITVSEAWIATPARKGDDAAVHLKVRNDSGRGTKLVVVESELADRAAMHQTVGSGDSRTMRLMPSLDVANGSSEVFAPSGRHVMLIGLKRDVTAGDTIPLRLTFLRGQDITVQVRVRQDTDGTS